MLGNSSCYFARDADVLKGYDEYAYINNFGCEQPQQALAVVTSHRGIILQAPIFCADRDREGW